MAQHTTNIARGHGAPPGDATYRTRALERGLALLSAFSIRRPELSLADLAGLADLDKATALRLLRSLEEYRFIERIADGQRYRLGLQAFELAAAYQGSHRLVRAAQPALDALATRCEQTSELGVLDGGEMVALAVAYPLRPLRRHVTLGERFSATCTSIGKVILADLPADRLATFLTTYPPVSHTPRTVIDRQRLEAEIAESGQRGYALDDEETVLGVSCVAAPVRDHTGRVVAAINVSGPTAEFQADRRHHFVAEVMATAASVSARLGYHGQVALNTVWAAQRAVPSA